MENITQKRIMGRSFILRRRVAHRRPVGYKRGECFHGFHAGLFSLYVSLRKPRKAVNFGKIVDK